MIERQTKTPFEWNLTSNGDGTSVFTLLESNIDSSQVRLGRRVMFLGRGLGKVYVTGKQSKGPNIEK